MIRGRAWKYGRNIDTDAIYPARYLVSFEPAEVARHAMEGVDPGFLSKIQRGDILIAETNFGTGSAREQAAMTLKFAGIGAVLADSFNRCFYRNAINNGLPVLTLHGISSDIEEGDDIEVDLERGRIVDHTSGEEFQAAPVAGLLQKILAAGGAVAYYRAAARAANEGERPQKNSEFAGEESR